MTPLTSHVSDDIFLHIPSPDSSANPSLDPIPSPLSPSATTTTINTSATKLLFFITGNPGLISYYHTFLTILSTTSPSAGYVIVGFSLGGFETSASSSVSAAGSEDAVEAADEQTALLRALQYPDSVKDGGKGVYGLREQIELCYARVEAVVRRLRLEEQEGGGGRKDEEKRKEHEAGRGEGHTPMEVILIAHSVGAYIALEIVRLWDERYGGDQGFSPQWRPSTAVLLMPTIIDLHKSPSGQLASPVLSTVPFMPELLQLATTTLRFGLPESWLRALVSKVTGMQPGTGLETTVKFLLGPKGVKQALHLARDELVQIRADHWGPEIWGHDHDDDTDTKCVRNSLKLHLLFAGEDHWIATGTRQQISSRGTIVQRHGLVHAWCLRQNEPVAEIVTAWLRESLDDRHLGLSGLKPEAGSGSIAKLVD